MFDYLSGIVADKRQTAKGFFITLDISGVGYLLETTEQNFSSCKIEDKCKFYTYLSHREDAMSLYGFENKETRDIFIILLSVSGVGVKMALALINQFNICDLISFVINGEYKELTLAKGIGTKLAQKIILELKDKLLKTDVHVTPSVAKVSDMPVIAETKTIMLSLGYSENEVEKALSELKTDTVTTTEAVLKQALLRLSM